ncbi:Cutin hydrolase [Cladobotryum mycophilum]|uniref:cutinase n=1 Tax=Cladobotryum mycophilum TaxID=491253 RepID=A0ABR0SY15_9HYPO
MPSTKSIVSLAALAVAVQASPLAARDTCDTANDFTAAKCANVGVIFARGTFDPGNIGPWVGCPFGDALHGAFGENVAFQGVDPSRYPADLSGYVDDGGSETGASALASQVKAYATRCPKSKIVISGWSQGALVAHKSFNYITDKATRDRIIALAVFGDPISVWSDTVSFPSIPSNTKFLPYCQTTTPDPLCANVSEDFPNTAGAFIDKLKAIWADVNQAELNDGQRQALSSLMVQLPSQASKKITKLGKDIIGGHLRRWLLTPEHFWYGVGDHPMTSQAAADIFKVYQSSH